MEEKPVKEEESMEYMPPNRGHQTGAGLPITEPSGSMIVDIHGYRRNLPLRHCLCPLRAGGGKRDG
jgi:hypothetical protein